VYGANALLRSVAVASTAQGSGLGRTLVDIAERDAAAIGVQRLFLLTIGATDYFTALGYHKVERAAAPAPVQASSQFSTLCPASATCISKNLPSQDG
jgi:amino-acid N-acetyltransferase